MSTSTTSMGPITKTVEVSCGVDHAFRVFTERIADWWPVELFSIHGTETTPRVDGGTGGEIYEISPAGERAHWADVEAWESPTRLVLAWRVNPEDRAAPEIEVRFEEVGPGLTRVELTHRNWELLGAERGAQARAGYDEGWDAVLPRYEAAAAG